MGTMTGMDAPTLFMVMLSERDTSGDEVVFERPRCILYTLDEAEAIACARRHVPAYPQAGKRWEDRVEIDTALLGEETF